MNTCLWPLISRLHHLLYSMPISFSVTHIYLLAVFVRYGFSIVCILSMRRIALNVLLYWVFTPVLIVEVKMPTRNWSQFSFWVGGIRTSYAQKYMSPGSLKFHPFHFFIYGSLFCVWFRFIIKHATNYFPIKVIFEDKNAFDTNQAHGEPVIHTLQCLRHLSYDL